MEGIKNILSSMRPEQWTKNLIIFAGLFFAKRLDNIETFAKSFEVFILFCILSSSSYIFNDVLDRKEDIQHPDKSRRPIPRGDLDPGVALAASAVLCVVGLLWSWNISPRIFGLALGFLALHVAYDLIFKHISIIDVFAIALAFIIRLLAGMTVSSLEHLISSWILLCTFLLALFLALCKRRAEMALLLDRSKHHRKSLEGYSPAFLDQLITIVAGTAILSYSLYALSAETIAKHGTDMIKYTIPFVVYGIFRYLYLVNLKKGGSNPEKILLRDVPFLINIVAYTLILCLIIYWG